MPFSLDEVEEQDLRRRLLAQARLGDAAAKAELFDLYGVVVYAGSERRQAIAPGH